jgi:hypothetical protein
MDKNMNDSGNGWLALGWIFLLAALGLGWAGLTFDVTVSIPGARGVPELGIPAVMDREVANIARLGQQALLINAALAAFVCTIIAFATHQIRAGLYLRTAKDEAPVAPQVTEAAVADDAGTE